MPEKQIYKKECPICGDFFETTNSRRVYCDECKCKDEDKKERRMKKAIKESKERLYEYKPHIVEGNCDICGKHIKAEGKYVRHTGSFIRLFCSDECENKFLLSQMYCRWCGIPIGDIPGVKPGMVYWQTQFCCDEHRKERMWHLARLRNDVGTCPECGKEFIGSSKKKFCSRACYLDAVNNGHIKPEPKEPDYVERKEKCPICGKFRIARYKNGKVPMYYPGCTPECEKKRIEAEKARMIKEKRRQKIRQAQEEKDRKKREEQIKLYNKLHGIKTKAKDATPASLCQCCKTSYKDCERMQSDFRIAPKGSKYENGLIVKCPKYKP